MKVTLFLVFCVACASAANFISNTLGDHMVLQRAPYKARIWGWATPGDRVSTELKGKGYNAITDKTGLWVIQFDAQPASPVAVNMTVTSSSGKSQTLTDILFGDVFLCSGQSNMQLSVAAVFNASQEIKEADSYPYIRLFTVGQSTTSDTVLTEFANIEQGWAAATSASVGNGVWSYFSATCWFHAKSLTKTLGPNVPLGLMSSNWGGTPVQAWSSPDAIAKCKQPEEKRVLQKEMIMAQDSVVGNPNPGDNSVLYNAMIYPLLNMRFRGAVWYQGEANAGQAAYYACQFPAMIADWRVKFAENDQEFSFFFVQLAPWEPADNNALGAIRQAQLAALRLPNVGYATAADLGDIGSPEGNIHPRNKQEVGRRLSLASRAITYGENVRWFGPLYINFVQTNSQVEVIFSPDSVGTGLVLAGFTCPTDPQYCIEFEVQVNNQWVPAKIVGLKAYSVVIGFTGTGTVAHVRYGWSAWPAMTIYSNDGLPAPPFTSVPQ